MFLTVEDDGVPFNPLDVPDVDVTVPLRERLPLAASASTWFGN